VQGLNKTTKNFKHDIDVGLLGCNAVQTCTLEKHIVALMMEAINSSDTSVNVYQTAGCNIPEDSHLQFLHPLLDHLPPLLTLTLQLH
jgi:hypothetical protein